MKKCRDDITEGLQLIQEYGLYVENLKGILWKEFSVERTVVIVVDLIQGFVNQGPLSSDRIFSLNQRAGEFCNIAKQLGIPILAFGDSHCEDSPEFHIYPVHCVQGTDEAKLTSEIELVNPDCFFKKNSTNAFLEPEFQCWLKKHPLVDQMIVIGCCTDICIKQFALTLKSEFNRQNRHSRIVVPVDLVETYDSESHFGDLFHWLSLYEMKQQGIEIVLEIK